MKNLNATVFVFGALFLLTPVLSYAQTPVSEDTLFRIDLLYVEALDYLTSEGQTSINDLHDAITAQIDQLNASRCDDTGGASVRCRLEQNLESLQALLPPDLASRLFTVKPKETLESPLSTRILGSVDTVLTAIGRLTALNRYLNRYQLLYLSYRHIRADAVQEAEDAVDPYGRILRNRAVTITITVEPGDTTLTQEQLLQHVDSLFQNVGKRPSTFTAGLSLLGYTPNVIGIGGVSTARFICATCLVSLHVLYADEDDGNDVGAEVGLGVRVDDNWGILPGLLYLGQENRDVAAVATVLYLGIRDVAIGASFSTIQGLGVKLVYNL